MNRLTRRPKVRSLTRASLVGFASQYHASSARASAWRSAGCSANRSAGRDGNVM